MKKEITHKIKNIKKGDQVKVIQGAQKGFLGIINSVITKKSSVILDGILPRIKYVKNPQGTKNEQKEDSKKIELPILIHVSNVMLWDKQINKASRIGYKESILASDNSTLTIKENLKKSVNKKRYFKKSGNFVP